MRYDQYVPLTPHRRAAVFLGTGTASSLNASWIVDDDDDNDNGRSGSDGDDDGSSGGSGGDSRGGSDGDYDSRFGSGGDASNLVAIIVAVVIVL